eukprot:tig00000093_g3487.t1
MGQHGGSGIAHAVAIFAAFTFIAVCASLGVQKVYKVVGHVERPFTEGNTTTTEQFDYTAFYGFLRFTVAFSPVQNVSLARKYSISYSECRHGFIEGLGAKDCKALYDVGVFSFSALLIVAVLCVVIFGMGFYVARAEKPRPPAIVLAVMTLLALVLSLSGVLAYSVKGIPQIRSDIDGFVAFHNFTRDGIRQYPWISGVLSALSVLLLVMDCILALVCVTKSVEDPFRYAERLA